jgi:translocation and assembly module TamB
VEGQVVTVGKRLTDRLYIAYDQGLTIATNALRIEYVLSRFFTVSAFTGTSSGVALNFRRSWR